MKNAATTVVLSILAALTVALAALTVAGCTGDTTPEATAANASNASAQTVELRFGVEGMSCQGCADFVQKTMGQIDGVTACTVSLEERQAVVTAESATTADAVLAAFDGGGYTVTRQ